MRFTFFFIACLFPMVFSGCGGGSGSTGNPVVAATTYSGQFIDAPTKGLGYTTTPSGLSGTTDDNGTFKFQSGDTVSFFIPTSSGNIDIGSAKPVTPSANSEVSILHVTTMDNGRQIAQTLQSLGGTGSTIDVSNVAGVSADDVAKIKDYIATGGASALPAKLTVTQSDALFNAMASLGNIPAKSSISGIASTLSDAVIVHTNILNAVWSSGSWQDKTIRLSHNGVTYFHPNGSTYALCVNSPWIDSRYAVDFGSNCEKAGIYKEGTWRVPAGSTNSFETTLDDYASFINTVTFKDLNDKQGLFTNAEPNAYGQYIKSFTGFGEYIFLNKNIKKSFLGGKTYYSSGNETCSDGVLKFVYSADGSSFERTCKTARADNAPNTPVTGTITDGLDIPGLLKMSFSNGDRDVYSGVTVDSTPSSGRGVIIVPGSANCGSGGNYSPSACGGMAIRTYSY